MSELAPANFQLSVLKESKKMALTNTSVSIESSYRSLSLYHTS